MLRQSLLAVLVLAIAGACSTPTLNSNHETDSKSDVPRGFQDLATDDLPDPVDTKTPGDLDPLDDAQTPVDGIADDAVAPTDAAGDGSDGQLADLAAETEIAAGDDYGAEILPDGATECAGVPGLTGDALLAMNSDQITSTLGYLLWVDPADQDFENPTEVTLSVTWPDNPTFICYPAYESDETGLTAQPRLAIPGLTLSVVTADGNFNESLSATAWTFTVGGEVANRAVIGTVHYDNLDGSYVIPEGLSVNLRYLSFRLGLVAIDVPPINGNVGAWPEFYVDQVDHGVYPGGALLAGFPVDQ